jgi:Pyruvate/2-oxoacid:ferredoxin oxidoreductase delta subunit
MSFRTPVQHTVMTKDEAREIVDSRGDFWVSTCWCRSDHGKCARSPMEVCLSFGEDSPANPEGREKVPRERVLELIDSAREWGLVTRAFRREGREEHEGICFCCDDCCSFFTGQADGPPARGILIERTIEGCCSSCGMCERACMFGARVMDEGELVVVRYRCFGCGVCSDTCPTECIEMVPRTPRSPARSLEA